MLEDILKDAKASTKINKKEKGKKKKKRKK
jgi:hypothetical protein